MNAAQTIQESIETKLRVLADKQFLQRIEDIADHLVGVYAAGNKVLIAGNGGSAADAQHFAAEIVCQYSVVRKGRPALALTVDTSALTAWGNDYSFDTVFARQVEALGARGDVLIVISTSGNSNNLITAAQEARTQGMSVVGLLGKGGGPLAQYCDASLIVPSESTPRIQEVHIMCIHMLCEALDAHFLTEDGDRIDRSRT